MSKRIDKSLKFPDNPRQITAGQFRLLKKHLAQLGDLSGIIYCRNNKAYTGGNMRAEVMHGCEVEIVEKFDKPTTQKTVAYGYVKFKGERFAYREVEFTGEEFRQACIVANSNGGSWDWDALSGGAWQDAPLNDWGLQLPEDWLSPQGKQEEDESAVSEMVDRAAELQKKWKVKRGQVWQIGRHRLMCGSSLDAADVERLTGGRRVELICTDPPYELDAARVRDALENYGDVAVILCGDGIAFGVARLWHIRLDFIWRHRKPRKIPTKNLPILFHSHAVVLTRTSLIKSGWRKPRPDFGSIIEVENEYEDSEMGHGKSAELFEAMLAGFSWQRVGDPFVGTGATLLACEAQGRTLVGMEFEPKTLAVALERAARSGLVPRLEV